MRITFVPNTVDASYASPNEILTPESGVYVVGDVDGALDLEGSTVDTDERAALLLRLDPSSGTHLDSIAFGSPGTYVCGLAASGTGVVLAGTYFGESITIGDRVLPATDLGRGDGYVAMWSADLEPRWVRLFSSDGQDAAYSVAFGADGSLLTVGRIGASTLIDVPLESNGSSDSFVVSLDRAGEVNWGRTFGTTADDEYATDVVVLDHRAVVSGLLRAPMPIREDVTLEPTGAVSDQYVISMEIR